MIDRDTAIRIDGFVIGLQSSLASLRSYMKNHLSTDDYNSFRPHVMECVVQLLSISNEFYKLYPDTTPKELQGSDVKPLDSGMLNNN